MNTIFSSFHLKYATLTICMISIFSISGGGYYEDFYPSSNSNYTPEAFVSDPSYVPLFLNNFDYLDDHSYRFVDYQVNDWNTYLENEITKPQLKKIIGSDSLNIEVKKVCMAIKYNDNNNISKKYNLKNMKMKHFFMFINLAKSIENATNFYPDWDYKTDTYSQRSKIKTSEIKKIEDLNEKISDTYIKEKYWFLTMKAYFYSENPIDAIRFFDTTSIKQEKNINYYRALSYVAGINYKQGKFALSNYQFALVFENCPVLRKEAIYNFKPQENADFYQSLEMTKNNDEKAALWALYGYYADPAEAITKIYALDAKNKHLPYLLTRAINIEENNLNSTNYDKYTEKAETETKKLDEKLYQLVIEIAKKNNTENPYIWQMTAGYLETLKGNYSSSENYLNEATKIAPQKTLVQNQIKIFTIYNQVSKTKVLNAKTENELLPNLMWLFSFDKKEDYYDTYTSDDSNLNVRTSFLINWTRTYISKLYAKQNNEVMAELFSRQENFYAVENRLQKMQTYFLENKNTAWDKMAQSLYSVTLDDIYEYKGILLAYKNKIDEAIIEFKKCKKTVFLLGNPFNGKIKDCNDCDHNAKQKTKFTKLAFLEKMKEIETNIANNIETYSGNILLGNAFYNMSQYGNARYFYNNPIIDQYGNYIDKEYVEIFTSNTFAENYYQKALLAAQNDEEKAKATYLLTKIERNIFYQSEQFVPYEVDFIAFNGYKKLIKNYSNTKYYQEIIKECGYFREVVY